MYRKGSDELATARAELVSYGARLLDDGRAVGSAGNLSVRMGDIVAITPSGIPYTDLRPADICLVTPAGAQLDEDGTDHLPTPSSETPMHLAIYAAASAAAVVHTHSPEVVALSASRPELPAAADWFLPNVDQLLALTGRDDLTSAIADVLALGTGGLAVTLGADGCVVAWRGGGPPVSLPAIEVAVVDTTGCGDGFTAGMLAGLLLAAGPVDAAWLGIACGSLVATGLGSDAGIEGLGQVLDFLGRAQPAVAGRIAAAAVGPLIHEGADP